jgi:hypothetical protein
LTRTPTTAFWVGEVSPLLHRGIYHKNIFAVSRLRERDTEREQVAKESVFPYLTDIVYTNSLVC